MEVFYNAITLIISTIIIIILFMIWKNDNIKRYFLTLVAGGALGNLYDRIVYTAVPDFIDLHFNDFHWFVFNVADIFITVGVFCLILVELFYNNKITNEPNQAHNCHFFISACAFGKLQKAWLEIKKKEVMSF